MRPLLDQRMALRAVACGGVDGDDADGGFGLCGGRGAGDFGDDTAQWCVVTRRLVDGTAPRGDGGFLRADALAGEMGADCGMLPSDGTEVVGIFAFRINLTFRTSMFRTVSRCGHMNVVLHYYM